MGQGNPHNVRELYGKYDQDIYILGSGATLDYFGKQFFDNKVVIGLNNIYRYFRCDYVVTHHHDIVQEAIDSGANVITSKHNISHPSHAVHDFNGDYYFYEHNDQGFCRVNMDDWGEMIVAGGTPVVAALQIAENMGAKNIILCGVDGGKIDGRLNYKEYPIATQAGHTGRVENIVKIVADKIRTNGVGVYYVIPFTNLTLDGHKFERDGSPRIR